MKAKAISIIVVLALCLSLVSVLTPPFSGPVRAATTWYVGPGESIQSIQTAVDAASPGDTIIVRDGTYNENVLVDKGLTIRSESGAATTVVQGADQDTQVFQIFANHVTISGFTVKKNRWDISSIIIGGGSSYCCVSNNKAEGIAILYSNNNTISNNTSSNSWAGIYVDNANNNSIFRNTFTGNGSNICAINANNVWSSSEQVTYTYLGNTYTNYLGNHWGGYGGSDANGDGIGDTPYNTGENPDNYPLMQPFENYLVSCPLGMVSYWKLNEGSGTTALDSVGSNHGTLVNGPVWTSGKVQGALSFDGVNDYVEIPDSNSLDLEGPFTLEAWVNPDQMGSEELEIIEKRDYATGRGAADSNYGLYIGPLGNPAYVLFYIGNGTQSSGVVGQTPIASASWTHVTAVFDGSQLLIYVNGSLDASGRGILDYYGNLVDPNGVVTPAGNAANLTIGALKNRDPMLGFDGAIDEVAIYNRALTAEEIAQHYQNGLNGLGYDATPGPIDTTPPGAVTDLGVSKNTYDSITLQWKAPADDGNDTASGKVQGYAIRYSTFAPPDPGPYVGLPWDFEQAMELWWSTATWCADKTIVEPPGADDDYVVGGLLWGQTYYLGVRAYDEAMNQSYIEYTEYDLTSGIFSKTLKAGFLQEVMPGLPPHVAAVAQITVLYDHDTQLEDRFWVHEIDYQYDGDFYGASRISIVRSGMRLWSATLATNDKEHVFYPNIPVYSQDEIELYTTGIPGASWNDLFLLDPTNPFKQFFRLLPGDALNTVTFDPNDEPRDPFEPYLLPVAQTDVEAIHIASPGELRVCDSHGNLTGVLNGNTQTEIPGSFFINHTIVVFYPEDSLTYIVSGTDEGEYGLYAASIKSGETTVLSCEGIPITAGATHQYTADWDALSQGQEGVTVEIDSNGDGTFEQTITSDATLAPPVALAGGPYVGDEGSQIPLDASVSHDPDGTIVSYEWDFGDGSAIAYGQTQSYAYGDNGLYAVTLTVTDDDGLTNTATASVTISNVDPSVAPITAPVDPVPVGTIVNASAAFTDAGFLDTHTAVWDWGDGSSSLGTVSESNGSGTVSDNHTYTAAGIYTVKLTVTDDDGAFGESVFQYVVVYDPSAGFVTGGGWIMSPPGAYTPDLLLTGKATFGFVAKYQKGKSVPTGQTQFQFHVAGLDFKSTSYQWLVIAGAKSQFKGSGTVNGMGDYGFILSAIDGQIKGGGGVDKFRIKIWDKAMGEVIYDNQMGAADDADATTLIGGGSIVMQKTSSVATAGIGGNVPYLGYILAGLLGCFVIAAGLFTFFMWGRPLPTRN